jgi:hypothetical protein
MNLSMNNSIKVKKYSGELVDFDQEKLIRSLRNADADEHLIEEIIKDVNRNLFDGISTKKIYQLAFNILKRRKSICASRYKLKKAIMELGPSGYPFEKYVGVLLNYEGFRTEVGVTVQGRCVTHEVDVVAIDRDNHYMVECKYHNRQGRVNDVKIPLYIQSRFTDLKEQCEIENNHPQKFHQGWVYTNTRFTTDAIEYAECVGLKLVSWDYPPNKSLKDMIKKSGLYPITSMAIITRKEKEILLKEGVVLCKEICEKPHLIDLLRIKGRRYKKIMELLNTMC